MKAPYPPQSKQRCAASSSPYPNANGVSMLPSRRPNSVAVASPTSPPYWAARSRPSGAANGNSSNPLHCHWVDPEKKGGRHPLRQRRENNLPLSGPSGSIPISTRGLLWHHSRKMSFRPSRWLRNFSPALGVVGFKPRWLSSTVTVPPAKRRFSLVGGAWR